MDRLQLRTFLLQLTVHVVRDSNKLFQYFLFEEKFHKKLLGSILLFGQLLQDLALR